MSALAADTGISRQALYKALSERGNPRLETVLKVANALGFRLQPVRRTPQGRRARPRSHKRAGPIRKAALEV